ncbi:HNH endonuclease [Streptomyces qinzhouensis]|uniref:HNH endonuclease n=1 Tax=Streptomyces qinzhouensis TaxID=2599401 RepID=A0A5B8IMF4_9ACTN|nr:HNH endonuclease signature motif containing protein [Streptomyces qinzhouensis]QDY79305.1 HNH endonuclease [Streptomyces qinzhouensis]QDY79782.1 HNH endonuclease [Streptomyces qinzhouensis]
MRCIDCPANATHRGRCEDHHRAYENRAPVRSRRSRGRRRAKRYEGAARLRALVDARGSGWCAWCLESFPAEGLEIDHVCPLAMGGEDIDRNVHALCTGCHGLKTRTEFGGARVDA